MKLIVYVISGVIYVLALLYLLFGALGFTLGVRVGGNMFADEGFGFQKTTYLILLLLLLSGGFYFAWRIKRRSS